LIGQGQTGLLLASVDLVHASVLRDLERLGEAESAARRALETREAQLGREHPLVADALDTLAWIVQKGGDFASAVVLIREALKIRQQCFGSEHPISIMTLADVGNIPTGQGMGSRPPKELQDAEAALREAASLASKVQGEDHPAVGKILSSLAWNLTVQGKLKEASELLDRALEIRRKALGESDPLITLIAHRKARVAYGLGDYAGAESALRELLPRYPSTSAQYRSVLEGLGIMCGTRGDFAEAEDFLSRAAQSFELSRVRAGEGLVRAAFWRSPYERLGGALLELGRTDEAWVAVERLQGLALSDMLFATGKRSLTLPEAAREDSLARRLNELENRLGAAHTVALDSEAQDSTDLLARDLAAAEAQWRSFQREMAQKHPVTEARTYPLARVQASLDESAAIIGWLDPEFGFESRIAWGYAIRRHGPVHWVRLASTLSPDSTATWATQRFRERLAEPAKSALGGDTGEAQREFARILWDDRIAPLLPHLEGVQTMIVVSSRAMTGVPIEAFASPSGETLVDRFAVHYAPSATIHAWLCERAAPARPTRESRALLVGDPPFRAEHMTDVGEDIAAQPPDKPSFASLSASLLDSLRPRLLRGERDAAGELPRLLSSRLEIEGVAASIPGAETFLSREASEENLRRIVNEGRLQNYNILHFATHVIVDNDRPEGSTLVLSQVGEPGVGPSGSSHDRTVDGFVSAAEVVREWKLDASLVTLSGCETALGFQTAEGTFGLAQTFLQAGARAVIVSLWPVDDEATALLMTRFYECWLGGDGSKASPGKGAVTKAGALAEARRWLRDHRDENGRQRFLHPYYWSGFVLIGDGR
jgi:CHAT domain-containing protein